MYHGDTYCYSVGSSTDLGEPTDGPDLPYFWCSIVYQQLHHAAECGCLIICNENAVYYTEMN